MRNRFWREKREHISARQLTIKLVTRNVNAASRAKASYSGRTSSLTRAVFDLVAGVQPHTPKRMDAFGNA